MTKYLLFLDGAAALVDIPCGFSSDAWGRLQDGFARLCGKRNPRDHYVRCVPVYSHNIVGDVMFHDELAGPGGASFEVYPLAPGVTDDDFRAVAGKLRRERDVVRMSAYRVRRWIGVPEELLGEGVTREG